MTGCGRCRLIDFTIGFLWALSLAAFGSVIIALFVGDLRAATYFALALTGSIGTLALATHYRLRVHG